MSEILQLDYYYGIEAEQFSFYRVPRLLIKDERFKKLSSDAKLLYGLMLDRMSLSIKNEWFDEDNRAYIIYTIDSIMEDLGCGKEKAVKVLAELDSVKGIGLVEKVRRGLGKPDIIYVKNFASLAENVDEKKSRNTDKITEVGKTDFKKSENRTSRSPEIELQEVGESNLKKSENRTKRVSQYVLKDEKEFVEQLKAQYELQCEKDNTDDKKELLEAKRRMMDLDALIKGLYENFTLGRLPERQFNRLMTEYDTEQSSLEQRISELETATERISTKAVQIDKFVRLVKKYRDFEELTTPMLLSGKLNDAPSGRLF